MIHYIIDTLPTGRLRGSLDCYPVGVARYRFQLTRPGGTEFRQMHSRYHGANCATRSPPRVPWSECRESKKEVGHRLAWHTAARAPTHNTQAPRPASGKSITHRARMTFKLDIHSNTMKQLCRCSVTMHRTRIMHGMVGKYQ